MRAVELDVGAGLDSIKVVDRPEPKAGRRQVLVKLAACSLNARDLGVAAGAFPVYAKQGLTPLSDGAGEVVAIGADVLKVKVGDRVAGCFFQRWPGGAPGPQTAMSALGGALPGVLAEYAVLEEDGVVLIPAHLSYQEAAALPCAAVTAWHALVEHGQAMAGKTILVIGSGGVSLFALQIGKALGSRVMMISSSDEKIERGKVLGAVHGVNYTSQPDWDAAVQDYTGGGVDHVVEVGGAGTFVRSLAALKTGGKISLIGALSRVGDVNPLAILAKRANIQGISVGSTQMFEALCATMSIVGMKPVIDTIYPMAEIRAAYRHMQTSVHFGKIVIEI